MKACLQYVKNFFVLVIMASLVTIFYDFAVNHHLIFLGFTPETPAERRELPVLDIVLVVISMVAGILFGTLHAALAAKENVPSFSVKEAAIKAFGSVGLWKSLLAAPLVFAGVYTAAQTQPDRVIALLFAFQNGFFCSSVLDNEQANKTEQKSLKV